MGGCGGYLYPNKGDTISKESTCLNKFVEITTYLLFLSKNKRIIDFFTSVYYDNNNYCYNYVRFYSPTAGS